MDAGKRITDLPEMESVPAGTAYLAESGDGAGTRHIKFEKLAEAIGKLLKLGNMEKLTTKEKSSFVGAMNEVNKKAETAFTGTDGIKAGTAGLVPAPQPEDEGKVLGSDGMWVSVNSGTAGNESGSSKGRLKTIEEIEANTEEGYDVDALPVKEINSKFGGITEFIVDEDSGKITGYKTKVGADTVFPFSSRIDLGKITGHSFSYSGSATTQYTMTTDIGKIVNISGFIGLYIRVGNTGAVSPSTVSIYIDTSTNNNNWSNVVTSSPCNRPGFSEITPYNQDKVILSSTVNARYVRIRITSTDRETVTINGSVIYSD